MSTFREVGTYKISRLRVVWSGKLGQAETAAEISASVDKIERPTCLDKHIRESVPGSNSSSKAKSFSPSQVDSLTDKSTSRERVILRSLPTSKCLYVDVHVGSGISQMLIDTGSPVSILSQSDASRLGLLEVPLEETDRDFFTANGAPIVVHGCSTHEIMIGCSAFEQMFVIAELDTMNSILGMDFLERYDGVVYVKKRLLCTSKGKFSLNKEKTSHCARIRVSEKIVVPEFSERIIECKLDTPVSHGLGVVEPNTYWRQKGLFVARSLVQANLGYTGCQR